ncbi:tRNA (guanosine(46)-N7)-methyltransferase TrmB [Porphyromonas circumdentaria]|uniref:tRNA (guanine(46)-N(7))-methyltransferase n=1 Tax=Porphyromonas circumdentaria TaxID=29524 RepID=A0A1T4KQV0_9PORP|nr:tRNA (guanosine(46)-N7)-methyltransferase TrmB [Porphyromonas circumdentaria]MBB6274939.1 tRNA (guanine-N7-)-methyltransferase [Porphyromonas circumdentaria]SJZ44819.1 tRNA (guanine-N7-)-methyltransferase [Porphyromonas circumdentaria]
MGQNKLKKFADIDTYKCVLQYPYARLEAEGFPYRGSWRENFFHSLKPIVVELGCGRGEYTVELAREDKERLYIGIDRKGARIWGGATIAEREGYTNVAFLRTDINLLERFFAPGEVDELWITFPDPQMNKTRARLVSSMAFSLYKKILRSNGRIHLKTDSPFLYAYAKSLLQVNEIPVILDTADLYGDGGEVLKQIPDIQTQFERQWLSRGKSIKYLSWYLPTDRLSPFIEPAEEPDHDDYHSAPRGYQPTKGGVIPNS